MHHYISDIPGLFFFIFVFSIQLTEKISILIFANDWIQTADLWNRKQPLYQLSHHHCPLHLYFPWWCTTYLPTYLQSTHMWVRSKWAVPINKLQPYFFDSFKPTLYLLRTIRFQLTHYDLRSLGIVTFSWWILSLNDPKISLQLHFTQNN